MEGRNDGVRKLIGGKVNWEGGDVNWGGGGEINGCGVIGGLMGGGGGGLISGVGF